MGAFDLKVLGEKLKAEGMPMLEATAEKAYGVVKAWVLESAEQEGGLLGAILPVAVASVDGFVSAQLNKIDGVEG